MAATQQLAAGSVHFNDPQFPIVLECVDVLEGVRGFVRSLVASGRRVDREILWPGKGPSIGTEIDGERTAVPLNVRSDLEARI